MSTVSGRAPARSASRISATTAGDVAGTPISRSAARRRYSPGTRQRTRSGARIPALRSWIASSIVATKIARAPAASAARATSTAPSPYAFALSTTSRCPPAGKCAFKPRTFCSIASRFTSTHAARPRGGRPAATIASGIPTLRLAYRPLPIGNGNGVFTLMSD